MHQQKSLAKERILQFQTLDCSNVRSRRRETNVDSQLSGSQQVYYVETPSRERLCSRCVCSFTIALDARFRSFVHWLSSLLRLAAVAARRTANGDGDAVMVLRLPMQLASTVVDDQKAIVYNAVHRHTTLGWHVFSRRSSTTVRAEQETTYDMYPKAMTGNITMG